MKSDFTRRKFISAISMLAVGTALGAPGINFGLNRKLKIALVGVGVRGTTFWGKRIVDNYGNITEFVGLCDRNPGRLQYAKKFIGTTCKTYSDFDLMVAETKPDLIIVATNDAAHHEHIIRGLELNCDVLTEKPLTTDEYKCQQILDADRNSKKNLIVGFNYRWSPYNTKIKQLLHDGTIGKITSVDFHWYLNTYHGASYFRRWHGLREEGGTLWVHKATHHFDLLNWWVNSEPEEVFAYGDLDFYGHKGPFRGNNCRDCNHTKECKFYWDITQKERMMELYVKNEKYDGYVRDNCLFREEINIYDKMSAQIKYKNNIVANYSLTTYSPFEGWRVSFNGTKGRIEASLDIPYYDKQDLSQEEMHNVEMSQEREKISQKPIILHNIWEGYRIIDVPYQRAGHGGGDKNMQDHLFKHPETKDSYERAAGLRDGAMSILIGVAARKSIESGEPIRIAELTDLEPRSIRL